MSSRRRKMAELASDYGAFQKSQDKGRKNKTDVKHVIHESHKYDPCAKRQACLCGCKIPEEKNLDDLKDENYRIKQQNSKLKDQLKLYGVDKRKLEAEIAKLCHLLKQQECKLAKGCLCCTCDKNPQSASDSSLYNRFRKAMKNLQNQKDIIQDQLENLKRSCKASCLQELKAEVRALASEICRRDNEKEVMEQQITDLQKVTAKRSSRQYKQQINQSSQGPLASLSTYENINLNLIKKPKDQQHLIKDLDQAMKVVYGIGQDLRFQFQSNTTLLEVQKAQDILKINPFIVKLLEFFRLHFERYKDCMLKLPGGELLSQKNIDKSKIQQIYQQARKDARRKDQVVVKREDLEILLQQQIQNIKIADDYRVRTDIGYRKHISALNKYCSKFLDQYQGLCIRYPEYFKRSFLDNEIYNQGHITSNDIEIQEPSVNQNQNNKQRQVQSQIKAENKEQRYPLIDPMEQVQAKQIVQQNQKYPNIEPQEQDKEYNFKLQDLQQQQKSKDNNKEDPFKDDFKPFQNFFEKLKSGTKTNNQLSPKDSKSPQNMNQQNYKSLDQAKSDTQSGSSPQASQIKYPDIQQSPQGSQSPQSDNSPQASSSPATSPKLSLNILQSPNFQSQELAGHIIDTSLQGHLKPQDESLSISSPYSKSKNDLSTIIEESQSHSNSQSKTQASTKGQQSQPLISDSYINKLESSVGLSKNQVPQSPSDKYPYVEPLYSETVHSLGNKSAVSGDIKSQKSQFGLEDQSQHSLRDDKSRTSITQSKGRKSELTFNDSYEDDQFQKSRTSIQQSRGRQSEATSNKSYNDDQFDEFRESSGSSIGQNIEQKPNVNKDVKVQSRPQTAHTDNQNLRDGRDTTVQSEVIEKQLQDTIRNLELDNLNDSEGTMSLL